MFTFVGTHPILPSVPGAPRFPGHSRMSSLAFLSKRTYLPSTSSQSAAMPFVLPLPEPWKSRGWKAKIAEKERLEPPHVTLYCRSWRWRVGLRDGRVMDPEPDPAEVPRDLLTVVRESLPLLVAAWDAKYPNNPVCSKEEEPDDE